MRNFLTQRFWKVLSDEQDQWTRCQWVENFMLN